MTEYLDQHYSRIQDELFSLLRIPSISPVDGFKKNVQECAALLADYMNAVGIKAKVCQTDGNPIIFGETEQIEGRPTILIYGHYDVQPEGDLENWESDPYEPEIRNGRIYARGVGDNKGQIFSHIKGYEVYSAVMGKPLVNLKYLIEGEEESGSVHLFSFAEENKEMLKADITIWSDANIHSCGRPVVLLGLKGISSLKITVKGPNRDVHSQFSSVLPNPVWKLAEILCALKDSNGNVHVPGFYEGAIVPNEKALMAIQAIPGKVSDFTENWGIDEVLHDVDMGDFFRRYMYEPTLNCGCISAGNPKASKNIVPSEASAWIDVRTVPGQKARNICANIEAYIHSLGYTGVDVKTISCSDAAYTSLDNPYVEPAIKTIREVWGKEPILYPALGGSGPYYVFNVTIGAPCIMIPYADAEQHDHGPNESMPVELFRLGILTSAKLIEQFAEMGNHKA